MTMLILVRMFLLFKVQNTYYSIVLYEGIPVLCSSIAGPFDEKTFNL